MSSSVFVICLDGIVDLKCCNLPSVLRIVTISDRPDGATAQAPPSSSSSHTASAVLLNSGADGDASPHTDPSSVSSRSSVLRRLALGGQYPNRSVGSPQSAIRPYPCVDCHLGVCIDSDIVDDRSLIGRHIAFIRVWREANMARTVRVNMTKQMTIAIVSYRGIMAKGGFSVHHTTKYTRLLCEIDGTMRDIVRLWSV